MGGLLAAIQQVTLGAHGAQQLGKGTEQEMTSMLPTYVLAATSGGFLVFCFVRVFVRKARVAPVAGGALALGIQVLLALVVFGMSLWSMVSGTPLQEIQYRVTQLLH